MKPKIELHNRQFTIKEPSPPLDSIWKNVTNLPLFGFQCFPMFSSIGSTTPKVNKWACPKIGYLQSHARLNYIIKTAIVSNDEKEEQIIQW